MNLSPLIYFSRLYGADPDLVTCGGGNTSMKEDGVMYVKGSGTALKDAVTETFVGMDLKKLLTMLDDEYPTEDAAREAKFLRDVTAAKLPGEEAKRPSVEALLHALFPQKFVADQRPDLLPARRRGLRPPVRRKRRVGARVQAGLRAGAEDEGRFRRFREDHQDGAA